MKSFVGCFMLQGNDQIRISNPKKEYFYLFSIRRIKKGRSKISDSKSSNITLFFESKDEKQQKSVSTIHLPGNLTYRIINEMYRYNQIYISKDGIDDVQLFFISGENNPHVFFLFFASQDQDTIKLDSSQNDQILSITENYPKIYNFLSNDIRRIKKSPNQLLLVCLSLHKYFPFSLFTKINLKRVGKLDFWIVIEKILYVFYNSIEKEKVLEEFKKCIDFLDFQISIDNDLSFGAAFLIATFLRFFKHQIFDLTKFFFHKKNFVTFLTVLTIIPKPINETLISAIMSYPLDPRLIKELDDEITISVLYQFILINCIKNKLNIFFHFSYLELFRKVAASEEELDFFLYNNNLVGIDNFLLSKNLIKRQIDISSPLSLDFKVNPFEDAIKKEKKSILKLENNCHFEKNEIFKADKIYNLWFKMKLTKRVRKHFCKYAPIYIRPNSDVEEDTKITFIYAFVSTFCLLFSVVILWKLSV